MSMAMAISYMVAAKITANLLYINDGEGNFTISGADLGSDWSTAIVLADVDGDDDLDLITANAISAGQSEANTILINDGAGNFSSNGMLLGDASSQCLAQGDVDGDGDLDVIFGNGDSDVGPAGNRLYLNDGNGNFIDSGQSIGSNITLALALGDYDGDGDLDLIEGSLIGPMTNQVYLNDGNGNFAADGSLLPGPSHITSLCSGDLDADGDLDVVASSRGTTESGSWIWFNDGAGTFDVVETVVGSAGAYGQALGDLDGDGDLDLAEMDPFPDGAGAVYLNDGNGSFSEHSQPLGAERCISVALGDLDDDGDLDLAVANFDNGPDLIYFNEYQGPDCDGNGVPDLCQLDPTTDTNGDGILDSCQGFIRGEINGDGSIDVADGVFLLNYLFSNGETPSCIRSSDINDDGTLNLADPITLLAYLFNNAPAPPTPFPDCGVDPTADALECESFDGC